jgi:hypothetical protein
VECAPGPNRKISPWDGVAQDIDKLVEKLLGPA